MMPQQVDTTSSSPLIFNPDTAKQDSLAGGGEDSLGHEVKLTDTLPGESDSVRPAPQQRVNYVPEPAADIPVIDSVLGWDTVYLFEPGEGKAAQLISGGETVKGVEVEEQVPPSHTLFEAEEKPQTSLWQTGVIIVVLLLVSLARALHPRRFKETLKAVLSNRFVSQIMREEKVYSNRANILLLAAYLLSFSLFVFMILNYYSVYDVDNNPIFQFFKISGLVILAYFLKIIALKIASVIFKTGEPTNEYIFNILTFNQFIGLVLILVTAGMMFFKLISSRYFIYSGLVALGILLVHRVFRGIKIASGNSVSVFYLFLYLCTLEILPLVVIIKVLSGF